MNELFKGTINEFIEFDFTQETSNFLSSLISTAFNDINTIVSFDENDYNVKGVRIGIPITDDPNKLYEFRNICRLAESFIEKISLFQEGPKTSNEEPDYETYIAIMQDCDKPLYDFNMHINNKTLMSEYLSLHFPDNKTLKYLFKGKFIPFDAEIAKKIYKMK